MEINMILNQKWLDALKDRIGEEDFNTLKNHYREYHASICQNLRHVNYSSETYDWCEGTEDCATAIRKLP